MEFHHFHFMSELSVHKKRRQDDPYSQAPNTRVRLWSGLSIAQWLCCSLFAPIAHAWRRNLLSLGPNYQERQEAQDAATAVVLYTWLLSAAHDNREENARLQPNLALAYSHFPIVDVFARFWQQVAREDFHADWARMQSLLGKAFAELPGGDRETHLRRAIGYYQAALQVYSSMHMDDDAQAVTSNLEVATGELQKSTQPQQLTQPNNHSSPDKRSHSLRTLTTRCTLGWRPRRSPGHGLAGGTDTGPRVTEYHNGRAFPNLTREGKLI